MWTRQTRTRRLGDRRAGGISDEVPTLSGGFGHGHPRTVDVLGGMHGEAQAAGSVSPECCRRHLPAGFRHPRLNRDVEHGGASGWDFFETGTNANTTYTAGTGSSNTGDTYSYGAAGTTERAFGGLLSGTLVPRIGAQFTNNTRRRHQSLAISYTGEQWRLGQNTAGRAADRLDFQLSTDATSLPAHRNLDRTTTASISPAR